MPRLARIVLPGFPHHITQRGNNKQDMAESVLFLCDGRELFVDGNAICRTKPGASKNGTCALDLSVFKCPQTYRRIGQDRIDRYWPLAEIVQRLELERNIAA